MTDQPAWLRGLVWFIGEVARPFAIIWTALCAGIAMLVLAFKIDDPVQAGVFIGVVYTTGVAPLFIGKAFEVANGKKRDTEVEIAKVNAPTT